jgi:hypothetical protein
MLSHMQPPCVGSFLSGHMLALLHICCCTRRVSGMDSRTVSLSSAQ